MKGLRLIIFGYCLLAALAGTLAIGLLGVQVGKQNGLLQAQFGQIEQLAEQHEDARDELLALREKQRLERDNYSAQQAIEASANTQVAIDREAQLQLELDINKSAHSAAKTALRQRETRLVPLLALTLLHWLLCPIVYRRKGQG